MNRSDHNYVVVQKRNFRLPHVLYSAVILFTDNVNPLDYNRLFIMAVVSIVLISIKRAITTEYFDLLSVYKSVLWTSLPYVHLLVVPYYISVLYDFHLLVVPYYIPVLYDFHLLVVPYYIPVLYAFHLLVVPYYISVLYDFHLLVVPYYIPVLYDFHLLVVPYYIPVLYAFHLPVVPYYISVLYDFHLLVILTISPSATPSPSHPRAHS